MADLHEEGPIYAFVLFLGRQPALAQEHVHFFHFHIQHLHLVQVPVSANQRVVVTDAYFKHLSQVYSLDGELIYLRGKECTACNDALRHQQQ